MSSVYNWAMSWFTTPQSDTLENVSNIEIIPTTYGPILSETKEEVWSGAARNAPNGGVNIIKLVESKPKDFKLITEDDLKVLLACLKKTQVNQNKYKPQKPAILKEFNSAFKHGNGYHEFLLNRRQRRAAIKYVNLTH